MPVIPPTGYWAGKIPAAPRFSAVPLWSRCARILAWFYYGNGMDLYQEMYDQAGYNVSDCSLEYCASNIWLVRETP
jgi:TRAP-type mannitol/chloroaromatic compound transport system substrate-binding protein